MSLGNPLALFSWLVRDYGWGAVSSLSLTQVARFPQTRATNVPRSPEEKVLVRTGVASSAHHQAGQSL